MESISILTRAPIPMAYLARDLKMANIQLQLMMAIPLERANLSNLP